MKQRLLGQTGLRVSELCLGTMSFGWRTRAGTALSLLDAYYDSGGNFIEAAGLCPALVAQPDWIGLPEVCIGEWLKTRAIPRANLVLATRLVWSPSLGRPGGNLSTCCDASLRRLATDYLDILVCDWTPDTPHLEDVFDGLRQLVDAGKVRHIGISGFAGWHLSQGRSAPAESLPISLVQENYSLLERNSEADLFNLDETLRPGFLARSPLAGGFLAVPKGHRMLHDRQRRTHLRVRYGSARAAALREAVGGVARELGASLAQVALAWVLSNPAVSSAIIAPLSLAQLQDAFSTDEVKLTRSQLRRLDLLSSSGTRWSDPEPDPREWSVRPRPVEGLSFAP